MSINNAIDHRTVPKAISRALTKTEEAYLHMPLMGSYVLVMLMRGEAMYLMNVGGSHIVLARRAESDVWNLVGACNPRAKSH